jgi:hypothetical protein
MASFQELCMAKYLLVDLVPDPKKAEAPPPNRVGVVITYKEDNQFPCQYVAAG